MGVDMARRRPPFVPRKMRTCEGRAEWLLSGSASVALGRSSGLVENITCPARLKMRMRSIPCFSAMVVQHGVPRRAGDALGQLVGANDHGVEELLLLGRDIDESGNRRHNDHDDSDREHELPGETPGHRLFRPGSIVTDGGGVWGKTLHGWWKYRHTANQGLTPISRRTLPEIGCLSRFAPRDTLSGSPRIDRLY